MSITTVAFTGHRPNKFKFGYNEDCPECLELKDALRAAIYKAIGKGAKHFISGMALGVDMWAAEEVLMCRKSDPSLTLEAAIPCQDQDKVWTQPLKDRYQNILQQCDKRTLVTDAPYRADLMLKRDRYMVDRCDLLIAVFDGSAGGTKHTYDYAVNTGKQIMRIDPRDLSITEIQPRTA